MKQTTLCFLTRPHQVLLGMKKRGFGIGKWNGVGGKVKEGEGVSRSAIREIEEEIGVTVQEEQLQKMGILEFAWDDKPEWNQVATIFLIAEWQGSPVEAEEIRPGWFDVDTLPFSEMWPDDPNWLPKVLTGQKIEGTFLFHNTPFSMLDFHVQEIA